MKKTITARLYVVDHADTRHQLTVTSAADLAAQVQDLTGNKQAATLARAAWGDDQTDLKIGGVRLVSIGAVIRETWRTLPPLRGQDSAEKNQPQQAEPTWADLKTLDEAGATSPSLIASEGEGRHRDGQALFDRN